MKNHDSLLNGFTLDDFPGQGHSICRAQVNTTLGLPSDSKNWPSKRFSATILSAQFQIQLMDLNQICPIFPSESLYIKSMFFELFGAYLEGNAVSSAKGCVRVYHYKMQCMTKVIQKHPETRSLYTFCRAVVPTQLFTNTALYYKMIQNAAWIWTNPPATKCFWGVWWWIKSQYGSLQNGHANGLRWKILILY